MQCDPGYGRGVAALRSLSLAACYFGNCRSGVVQCFDKKPLTLRPLFIAPREQAAKDHTHKTNSKRDKNDGNLHVLKLPRYEHEATERFNDYSMNGFHQVGP
jgi:hypothetical protein